eukprot:9473887-Pyramimonas_sp.AAC.1
MRQALRGVDRCKPETHPLAGAPYGLALTSSEDGQGGPRGVGVHPAEEAIAECLGVDANVGLDDKLPAVGGHPVVHAGTPNPRPPIPSGVFQPIAAKVPMKIFYGARVARYHLFQATCTLASCGTKWTEKQDTDIFRFICYIQAILRYRMVSGVGDGHADARLKQYADADLA